MIYLKEFETSDVQTIRLGDYISGYDNDIRPQTYCMEVYTLKFIIILIFSFISDIVLASQISYIRYYASEKDFIANVPMKSTNRRGNDHLTAYFNDKNLPVKLEYYISNGSLRKREIMEYNSDNVLMKKGEVDSQGKIFKISCI